MKSYEINNLIILDKIKKHEEVKTNTMSKTITFEETKWDVPSSEEYKIVTETKLLEYDRILQKHSISPIGNNLILSLDNKQGSHIYYQIHLKMFSWIIGIFAEHNKLVIL